jgi:hypothetical protein
VFETRRCATLLTMRAGEGGGQQIRPDLLFLFETPHNRTITWDHMLRQTSDWEGTLWGKPDWADRPEANAAEWRTRQQCLAPPDAAGAERDDHGPIGASNTWRWFGYENSWVVLDGSLVQSVTGGGHWGGGMYINAYDMARFGYLTLRGGRWRDRQIIS